jgi:hypothetical protein
MGEPTRPEVIRIKVEREHDELDDLSPELLKRRRSQAQAFLRHLDWVKVFWLGFGFLLLVADSIKTSGGGVRSWDWVIALCSYFIVTILATFKVVYWSADTAAEVEYIDSLLTKHGVNPADPLGIRDNL